MASEATAAPGAEAALSAPRWRRLSRGLATFAFTSRLPAKTPALRKFARGVEQVERLRSEVEAFERGDAHAFRTDVEWRTANSITYRWIATQWEPPSDGWPLLAGEAIQNLRASLDHVVWASAEPPSDQNAFPICTDSGSLKNATKTGLRDVPAPVRAAFERWQPYSTSPDTPAHAMLEDLRTPSNLDKHRMLTAFAPAIAFEGVDLSDGIEVTWDKYGTNRPLGGGDTHVSTFVATSEAGTVEVMVQPHFSHELRIEGHSVSLLRASRTRVASIRGTDNTQAMTTTLSMLQTNDGPDRWGRGAHSARARARRCVRPGSIWLPVVLEHRRSRRSCCSLESGDQSDRRRCLAPLGAPRTQPAGYASSWGPTAG